MLSFEEVYARFRRPVWSLARRLTDSEDEALDACQEIFVRVWKGLPGFRGEAKLSTWVFQIAWNHLRAYRRKRGKQPFMSDIEDLDRLNRLADEQADPERRAGATAMVAAVERALALLPEHYRLVLWLRDGEGLSYEQIATVLDVPLGTVRSRLARARASLREMVEGS
jgi:RNA polymerase sigma factor (sigma-70 family)